MRTLRETVNHEDAGDRFARPRVARGIKERTSRALRRIARPVDRLVFPEASSAQDQWLRVVMNGEVDRYLEALGPSRLSAAEISGAAHRDKDWRCFRSLNFPEFDICAAPSDELEFDVVICEQVLEHVVDPWTAAANLRALCAPGGHVVVTVPFMVRVHELPLYAMKDYWRFTPRGLGLLLETAGLEIEAMGEWGNWQCVLGNLRRWSAYRPWHSLRNGRDIPIQVWAFARNPG